MPAANPADPIWVPLLISPNDTLARALEACWHKAGEKSSITRVAQYPDRTAMRELLAANTPSLCFLDAGTDWGAALGVAGQLRDAGLAVVALHTCQDPDLILNCLRHGAAEFLHMPFGQEQLRSALDRLAKRAQAAVAQSRSGGEVFCMLSGKSGSGSTTLACNLAFQLHGLNSQKVLLSDFDPLTGTVAFLLKLSSQYNVAHALANYSRMDDEMWKGMVVSHRGVDVLLSQETPAEPLYEADDLTGLVNFWKRLYEYVIIDIPSPYSQLSSSVAALADELLVVTTNELPAVHAAQNSLACLKHYGIGEEKIKLVVNRYNPEIGLSSSAIESALEVPVFQHVPSDFQSVQRALMEGRPVPASSRVGKAIVQLSEKLTGSKRQPKKHSLFGSLFSAFQSL